MESVSTRLDGVPFSDGESIHHEQYAYTPLSTNGDEIRILDLAPSMTWESQVYVRLRTIRFSDEEDNSQGFVDSSEDLSPGTRYITEQYQRSELDKYCNRSRDNYEALSYVWGSTENMATILVTTEGIDDLGELKVTRNCEEALKHLRLAEHLRVLWVDAICINQASDTQALEERGRQVAMMASIYRRAIRVRCWLGPSADAYQLAIDWVHLVSSHVAMDFTTSELVALSDAASWTAAVHTPGSRANISLDAIASLTRLLQAPYFERLWIWQEIRFGQGRAYLMLGKERIFWPRFCAALRYCCDVSFPNHAAGREFYDRLSLVSRLVNPLSRTLLHAIDSMRSCRCSDQRDRVYTAQAFELAKPSLRMVPDYTHSVVEVWTAAIRRYMDASSILDFFTHLDGGGRSIPGLPSWVPDWSQPKITEMTTSSEAGARSQIPCMKAGESTQLTLHGRIVAVTARVAQFRFSATDVRPLGEEAHEAVESIIKAMLSSDADVAHIHSLASVLCLGKFAHTHDPPRPYFPLYDTIVDELTSVCRKGTAAWDTPGALHFIRVCCNGRSLFQTTCGRFGLGPKNIRAGDAVAVFLGCPTTVVLRSVDAVHHSVVGDAFVEGLMNGEAFLGPMSDEHERVIVTDDNGEQWSLFRNVKSKDIYYDDPRLKDVPLPTGWRDCVDDADLHAVAYHNTLTGEYRDYRQDPRCDAVELERRGVELDNIVLL